MFTEAQRRREGRLKAERMLNNARMAVDYETRDLFERVAVRAMLKGIGIEVGATPLATDSIAPQVRRGVHAAPRGEGC